MKPAKAPGTFKVNVFAHVKSSPEYRAIEKFKIEASSEQAAVRKALRAYKKKYAGMAVDFALTGTLDRNHLLSGTVDRDHPIISKDATLYAADGSKITSLPKP